MKTIGLVALIVVVMILQLGFVPAVRPLGVVPNLALVLVILVGLSGTVSRALFVALAGGLLLDLTSGADFGLRTGLFGLAAIATGMVRRAGLNLSGVLVPFALVAAGTVLADLVVLASLVPAATAWPLGHVAGTMALELVLNLLATLILRPLVGWLTPADTSLPQVG